MPSIASERMSRVDTAWLRMDNEVNLMMIVGVWLLQPALDYDELCERVAAKLLHYDRFRQKVVQDALGAHWVDDDGLRHPSPRGAREARAPQGPERARCAAGAVRPTRHAAARPCAAAVAVPPDRALRGRLAR